MYDLRRAEQALVLRRETTSCLGVDVLAGLAPGLGQALSLGVVIMPRKGSAEHEEVGLKAFRLPRTLSEIGTGGGLRAIILFSGGWLRRQAGRRILSTDFVSGTRRRDLPRLPEWDKHAFPGKILFDK